MNKETEDTFYFNRTNLEPLITLFDPRERIMGDEAWGTSGNVSINYPDKGLENGTNSTSDQMMDFNQYILPFWQQLMWSLVFGVMVVVATGGNLIVIWIVLAHKRMRTVTNIFIVNLSIADTMVSTLNVIFNFIYMLHGDWPFGELYCKMSNFIAIVSVGASVFTLMAISIDRYMAIKHPLRPRITKKTALNTTLCIWLGSSVLSFPNVIFSTTEKEFFTSGEYRDICFMIWPDGPSTQSVDEYIYNVVILLVTYFVPITSMSFTYFRVGRQLWGSQSIGECTAKQVENIKSKRKIVKMMIVVLFLFAVCWLPYHMYFLLAHHRPEIIESVYVQHIYLSIYWLAMSNSMYNPMIYCWMNSRFREGFRKAFCLVCIRSQDTRRVHELRYQKRFSLSEATIGEQLRVRSNSGTGKANGNGISFQTFSNALSSGTSGTLRGRAIKEEEEEEEEDEDL